MLQIAKANNNYSRNSGRKYFWTGGILLFLILCVLLFAAGYRFGGPYLIGKVGTINMTMPLADTAVYIDNSDKVVTSTTDETVSLKLSPGTHTIIVSNSKFLPWKKDIKVESGKISTISPLFVSQSSSGVFIGTNDPEYNKIKKTITSYTLPTKTSPITSKDGNIQVWVEYNAILAKVGDNISTVIQPTGSIKNVNFYKDRSDALIFSMDGGIYVIDVNKEDTQNFLPLYMGQSPEFVIADSNSIYIWDKGALMQLSV